MMKPQAQLAYRLHPDSVAEAALVDMIAAYGELMRILADIDREEGLGANLVVLHKRAYDLLRERTGLPSQYVVLGLRDFAAHRGGVVGEGVPLDDKLYAIKGSTALTLATRFGRVSIPFDVLGYRDEPWQGFATARLVRGADFFELHVGVTPHARIARETTMSSEGVLQRIGRLIAGFTHAAIDKAEGLDKVAVVEQAIREIDKAADDARSEVARAAAEQHRIRAKRAEVEEDMVALRARIGTAIREGREDLARAGVERSLDLDAQITALDSALADVDARIDDTRKALLAVAAAREDAQARLRDLRRSERVSAEPAGAGAGGDDLEQRVARSSDAISRVTGVPGQPGASAPAGLDELERLHRAKLVEERLAQFKASD